MVKVYVPLKKLRTTLDPDTPVQIKDNCHKCHGRGYVGVNTRTSERVLCRCLSVIIEVPDGPNGQS